MELENCIRPTEVQSAPKHHLKLTLPDYKLCSAIENFEEPILLNNVNESPNFTTDNIPVEPITDCLNNPLDTDTTKEIKDVQNFAKKNVCTICKKGFISKVWFAKHMEKEHSGQKYSCPHCSKSMYYCLFVI